MDITFISYLISTVSLSFNLLHNCLIFMVVSLFCHFLCFFNTLIFHVFDLIFKVIVLIICLNSSVFFLSHFNFYLINFNSSDFFSLFLTYLHLSRIPWTHCGTSSVFICNNVKVSFYLFPPLYNKLLYYRVLPILNYFIN